MYSCHWLYACPLTPFPKHFWFESSASKFPGLLFLGGDWIWMSTCEPICNRTHTHIHTYVHTSHTYINIHLRGFCGRYIRCDLPWLVRVLVWSRDEGDATPGLDLEGGKRTEIILLCSKVAWWIIRFMAARPPTHILLHLLVLRSLIHSHILHPYWLSNHSLLFSHSPDCHQAKSGKRGDEWHNSIGTPYAHTHTRTNKYTLAHTHIHTCTNTNTHTHIHTCMWKSRMLLALTMDALPSFPRLLLLVWQLPLLLLLQLLLPAQLRLWECVWAWLCYAVIMTVWGWSWCKGEMQGWGSWCGVWDWQCKDSPDVRMRCETSSVRMALMWGCGVRLTVRGWSWCEVWDWQCEDGLDVRCGIGSARMVVVSGQDVKSTVWGRCYCESEVWDWQWWLTAVTGSGDWQWWVNVMIDSDRVIGWWLAVVIDSGE